MGDSLPLRKKTEIDQVLDNVPQSDRHLPQTKLPGWKNQRIANKLPNLKFSEAELFFSRNKVGRPIHRYKTVNLNNIPNIQYQALHDVHLQEFWQNKKLLEVNFTRI